MDNNMYWISTITYAIVLTVIYYNEYRAKRRPNEVEKAFRLMASWVIFFCIQDTFWGLCDSYIIKGDKPFFLASTIFHASTVLTTFFWLNYVLIYLGEKIKRRKLYLVLDGLVILAQILLLIINFFTPTLFTIENNTYVTGYLRPIAFGNQYMIYLAIGVVTFIFAVKEKGKLKKRYWSVFVFALAPILLGIFQLLYPRGPFYSLGYFLGTFIVYTAVVSKDRSEAARGSLLRSIAETYYSMHLIDLNMKYYDTLIEPDELTELINGEQRPQFMLNTIAYNTAKEEYLDVVLAFVNLSDLSERMKDKKMVALEYITYSFGWVRIVFFSVEKREDVQSKVMFTMQIIDSEKKKQLELLYKTNNDELTGLLNRRAFENDIELIKKPGTEKNLVFVSMDVNGLKQANDTLGHSAGDELITGAAMCMKKCFGSYGKIYRTGGDEFNAILYANQNQLEDIKKDFEDAISSWRGQLVSDLSVASGFIVCEQEKNLTIHDIWSLADKKMYEEKAIYYNKKGFDRRGQKNAHTALCALYTKILKINITYDTYQIINIDDDEKIFGETSEPKISEWINGFVSKGYVHPDDQKVFLEKMDLDNLRRHFLDYKSSYYILYRRKTKDEYKNFVLELIPANDYKESNQTLFLYVKQIEG